MTVFGDVVRGGFETTYQEEEPNERGEMHRGRERGEKGNRVCDI